MILEENTIVDEFQKSGLDIDINIILEKPFLNKYILSMRKNLGILMNIEYNCISIKATTSDKLGFIGKQEGVMSTATILLAKSV